MIETEHQFRVITETPEPYKTLQKLSENPNFTYHLTDMLFFVGFCVVPPIYIFFCENTAEQLLFLNSLGLNIYNNDLEFNDKMPMQDSLTKYIYVHNESKIAIEVVTNIDIKKKAQLSLLNKIRLEERTRAVKIKTMFLTYNQLQKQKEWNKTIQEERNKAMAEKRKK
jgi:hypothetical protein